MGKEWETEDEGRWRSGKVVPEGGPLIAPWRGSLRLRGKRIISGGLLGGFPPPSSRWGREEWERGVRHGLLSSQPAVGCWKLLWRGAHHDLCPCPQRGIPAERPTATSRTAFQSGAGQEQLGHSVGKPPCIILC